MDDGSDYDVLTVARAVRPDVNVFAGRQRVPTEHVKELNFGRFLDAATKLVSTPYVAYLCDDDFYAEGWLKVACEHLANYHVVVGEVVASNGRSFPSLSEGHFCLGNFALRMECFVTQCDKGAHRVAEWGKSWSPENHLRDTLINAKCPLIKVDDVALHALQHAFNLSNNGDISLASKHWEGFVE